MENARELLNCRLCHGPFYTNSVKLRESPLANELYPSKESALLADKFALEIVMCIACKHIQLKHIVNPARLFSEYIYASGTSITFQNHFVKLAEKIGKLVPGGIVVEIGSNDGTLLEALRAQGLMTVGVEPSGHLASMSSNKCDFIYQDFLDANLCERIVEKHGFVDLVVGNNVFAHIDDLIESFKNVLNVLKTDGYFIFEVAHVLSLVQNHLFDTIYHEHMSYHSIISLGPILKKIGFSMIDVEEIETHGGSIRVICQKSNIESPISEQVQDILKREHIADLDTHDWMEGFNNYMKVLFHETETAISVFHSDTLWFGYGAPAKAVTFINEFGLESLKMVGIIDDNPEKQGKFMPTSGIKVVSKEELLREIDGLSRTSEYVCIIFPWNLSDEILEKLPNLNERTLKAVWFLPTFKARRVVV